MKIIVSGDVLSGFHFYGPYGSEVTDAELATIYESTNENLPFVIVVLDFINAGPHVG